MENNINRPLVKTSEELEQTNSEATFEQPSEFEEDILLKDWSKATNSEVEIACSDARFCLGF